MRAISFLTSVGLVGAVLGRAIGGLLGRLIGRRTKGDQIDGQARLAVWVAVLVGATPFAVLGWFLGVWAGTIATRGCQEMGCLTGLLWSVGGVFLGAMAGGAAGAASARRLRPHPESGSRTQYIGERHRSRQQ